MGRTSLRTSLTIMKKPRQMIPGVLASQMSRGRQFEYAPKKSKRDPAKGFNRVSEITLRARPKRRRGRGDRLR